MPVYQFHNITFRPIPLLQYQSRTVQSSIPITFSFFAYRSGSLCVTPCMTIPAPLYMQKMFYFSHLFPGHFLIIRIDTAIPTRPDRRRIYIYNITTESATADSRLTSGIKMVGQSIQFTHQTPYFTLFKLRKIIRPVVFIA